MSFKKFKAPSLPTGLPSLPSTPSFPSLPKLPSTPSLSLPSTPNLNLPGFPSSKDLADAVAGTRAKLTRNMSWITDENEGDEKDAAELPPQEPVYIVLRPLALTAAPKPFLKGVGHIVKDFQFEHYLLLQHWGVLIGEHYYHLHIDDNDPNKKISVSMIPFVDVTKNERHTLKIPIWRTRMTHEERVGIAVGVIKSMGQYSSETEVEIADKEGNKITSEEVRARYTMKGRYKNSLLNISMFHGGYNAVTNNCIHFTKHYILEQLVTRKKEMKDIAGNIQWVVAKWTESGCKRDPIELAKFLSGLLCINPFTMTPDKGARVMIKILSIFTNVPYNPELDKTILNDSTENADEALETMPETTLGDHADSAAIEAEMKALKVEDEK